MIMIISRLVKNAGGPMKTLNPSALYIVNVRKRHKLKMQGFDINSTHIQCALGRFFPKLNNLFS